jgi:hypothetical protein
MRRQQGRSPKSSDAAASPKRRSGKQEYLRAFTNIGLVVFPVVFIIMHFFQLKDLSKLTTASQKKKHYVRCPEEPQ